MRSSDLAPRRLIKAVFAMLLMAGWVGLADSARAVTMASVGTAACTTPVGACTINVSSTVPSGSGLLIIATIARSIASGVTVTDSAGNCAGYTVQQTNSAPAQVTIVAAFCSTTASALASGIGTITISSGAATQTFVAQAFLVAGFNSDTFFDRQGVSVAGSWTSNVAITGATTPMLGYSSEFALAVTAVGLGSPGDSLGSYTGGYSSIASLTGGTNGPEMFIAGQTIVSGTATYGAAPTSSAGRAYLSQVFLFPGSGATPFRSQSLTLIGVAGGGSPPLSSGSQLDVSNPANSALLGAL